MNRLKTPAALAVLCALSAPALAESFDVKVTGKISPPACTPSLGNGGTFDYGNIDPKTLSASASTNLAQMSTPFTITCKSAAKVAVGVVDNRAGTNRNNLNATPTMTFNNYTSNIYASIFGLGLGTDGKGNNIGGYALVLSYTATLDDAAATLLVTGGAAGTGWAIPGPGSWALTTGNIEGRPYSDTWTTGTGTTPTAFQVMNTTLMMQAYITKTSDLDISKPISLDGSSTIELTYL
jgi:hypothetical protein